MEYVLPVAGVLANKYETGMVIFFPLSSPTFRGSWHLNLLSQDIQWPQVYTGSEKWYGNAFGKIVVLFKKLLYTVLC